MAWLGRIAENEIRDRVDYFHRQRRDVRKNIELDEAHAPAAAHIRSALSELIIDQQSQHLEQALETLSEQHREVIVLRKLEEMGWREIAARLGKSDDACRMLLARAMTSLTMAMESGT